MTGRKLICAAAMAAALAGCQGMEMPFATRGAVPAAAVKMVERDVEAPEVFQMTQDGTWDGRPSLGAVWIAHDEAEEPLRTIIRRQGTEEFVIGMLYKRSATNPGTGFQVSADAAEALGLSAGEPALLDVTALVPEQVPEDAPEETPLDAAEPIETDTLAPAAIEVAALEPAAEADADIGEDALAAISEVVATAARPAAPEPEAAPEPAAPAPVEAAALTRPYVQIGIFSVEQNAEGAAASLRARGAQAELIKQETAGKTFWRVRIGPAGTQTERDALIDKAWEAGFADAYAVKS